MMRMNTAAAMVLLLLPHYVAWGQSKSRPIPSEAKTADAAPAGAPAGPQKGAGQAPPDEATRHFRTLRIVNADGGPASGAKVLLGDPKSPRVIFSGRQLGSVETISRFWTTADRRGQITINKDRLLFQGDFADSTGYAMPPLMILGQKDEVAFLPPGLSNNVIQLRPMARIVVLLRLPTDDPFSSTAYSVLAWWNNGFAVPHQPGSLGYSQSGSVDGSWKFRSHFEVFQAVRIDANPFGSDHPTAVLYVPPGEVRLTIVPTNQLPAFTHAEGASSETPLGPAGTVAEPDVSHLQNLALFAGPSHVIAVGSGGTEAVSFDHCVHSVRLRATAPRQPLPEWDESSDENQAVVLVRQVDLPGDETVSVEPGSPEHESILRTNRPLRSKLPPVRMGRRGSDGAYRFDLLCPGTYQLRLASRLQLRSAPPGEYAAIGQAVRIRPSSKPPEHNPFESSHRRLINAYDYAVAPEGDGWDDLLVIHPAPNAAPSAEDPFAAAPSAEDPFAAAPSAEDPFAAAPSDEDPFAAAPSAEDPFAATPSAEDPFAAAPSAEDLFGASSPIGESDSRSASATGAKREQQSGKPLTRQAQLQELRLRIRMLQEQLQAASELVDQLEAQ